MHYITELCRFEMEYSRIFIATVLSSSIGVSANLYAADEGVKDDRPNIILILSDDMGFSDIGCYGGEIKTPNLDKLAERGVRFTQFYNTARCCPTRASLLTGLHPHQTGVGHMETDRHMEAYRGKLNNKCVTIAEVLQASGYSTVMTGKWHVAGTDFDPKGNISNWPCQRGFEKYYGSLRGAGSFYDPPTLRKNNEAISPYADPDYKPDRYYYTDAISDYTVRYINEHEHEAPDKPFFAYVAYTAAHWPMHAFEEDIEKYKGVYDAGYEPIRRARYKRLQDLGIIDNSCKYTETVGDWDDCQFKAWEARCMEVYAAMVTRMDEGIGKIVAALEAQGQLDNTLIMFLQDNGGCAEDIGREMPKKWYLAAREPMADDELQNGSRPPMYTRQGLPFTGGKTTMPGPDGTYIAYGENWANVSNTPFKQYKHWIQEGGISTPLIAFWPNGIDSGSNGKLRRQASQIIDIMATVVDIAGADYPTGYHGSEIHPMEGVSLLSAFNSDAPLPDRGLFWEHEGNRAVRFGDWKLVSAAHRQNKYYDKVEELPLADWQLYNIEEDRSETTDLAGQYPERVREMADLWHDWAINAMAFPKPD